MIWDAFYQENFDEVMASGGHTKPGVQGEGVARRTVGGGPQSRSDRQRTQVGRQVGEEHGDDDSGPVGGRIKGVPDPAHQQEDLLTRRDAGGHPSQDRQAEHVRTGDSRGGGADTREGQEEVHRSIGRDDSDTDNSESDNDHASGHRRWLQLRGGAAQSQRARPLVVCLTPLVALLLVSVSALVFERFHGQLPETIRTHIFRDIQNSVFEAIHNYTSVQQIQGYIPLLLGFVKEMTKEQQEPGPFMGEMQVPTNPNKNEYEVVEKFEQDKEITNIKHLSRCQRWTNVNATHYDQKVERLGKGLNLPVDMIEELKFAKYSDEEVSALEKFDLGHDGMFYVGKFTSKRRDDRNMDLALVLYGFSWNQINKNWISGGATKSLQSMTPKQKDLCLKIWRSKAVDWFSESCQKDLLKVVEQTRIRSVSSVNIEEEDKIKLNYFERLVKTLEESGIPVPVEL